MVKVPECLQAQSSCFRREKLKHECHLSKVGHVLLKKKTGGKPRGEHLFLPAFQSCLENSFRLLKPSKSHASPRTCARTAYLVTV